MRPASARQVNLLIRINATHQFHIALSRSLRGAYASFFVGALVVSFPLLNRRGRAALLGAYAYPQFPTIMQVSLDSADFGGGAFSHSTAAHFGKDLSFDDSPQQRARCLKQGN